LPSLITGPALEAVTGALASQVEALRKQGSHVEVITPDADSRAAMGTNQMDPATRIPAARAGFAQGQQEATRVTFL
jgi:NTE family protein